MSREAKLAARKFLPRGASMARYMMGRELGRRICEALGIDPGNVAGVTIDCDVAGRALVVVEYYLPEDATERIVDDLRWYRLVEAE